MNENTVNEPSSDHFYENLPSFKHFDGIVLPEHYHTVPSDWYVIITDVIRSTDAIAAGKYKQVNSVGVASIVALLNVIKPLNVPYVFGGDGATACIPRTCLAIVKTALAAARAMAKQQFNLDLRIGIVSVADINTNQYPILIAKHQPHKHFQQAMFSGNGLSFAEKLVKAPSTNNPYLLAEHTLANTEVFNGFECRWNEIPSAKAETIALLIQALPHDAIEAANIYKQVLNIVADVYGTENQYHPLKLEHLTLSASFKVLSNEANIRTAFQSTWQRLKYSFKLQILRLAGIWLMSQQIKTSQTDWGKYKQQLLENTDYQKFDDTLRMIMSGSVLQRQKLRTALTILQEQHSIVFGIHAAPAALMTCMVHDYQTDHVHFLDVANGGYAMAAVEMKRQIKSLNQTN